MQKRHELMFGVVQRRRTLLRPAETSTGAKLHHRDASEINVPQFALLRHLSDYCHNRCCFAAAAAAVTVTDWK